MAREKRRAPLPGGAPLENADGNQQRPQDSPPPRRRSRRPPGLIPIGPIAAEIVADLKFRHQVERLHRLGPRAVAELLAELGAERSIATIIDHKLGTYVELSLETLEAAGGDGFWAAPIHEVPR